MVLRIHHETRLSYSSPVAETVFEVRMAPPTDDDQTILSYRLQITPTAPVMTYRDGFGNRVELFNVPTPYQELVLQATSFVRVHRRPAVERLSGVGWPFPGGVSIDALEFLQPSPLVDTSPALDEVAASLGSPSGPLDEVLREIMAAVRARIKYEKRSTTAQTKLSEALDLGRGVCQDLAHLFLGVSRRIGLPARYVSGYVNHPGEIATHAWCQVWAGDRVGWVDVDPTPGAFVGDDHVVTAVGRDYSDVPPNRGVWHGSARESMDVTVTVEPVDRVPFDWNGWFAPVVRWPALGDPVSFLRRAAASRLSRPNRAAYPNQPRPRTSLLRQQGQQQQQQQR